ncbi:MAG: shikimate dehydrogenase [Ruminococcaceae bacterium]|nr:shikimate dehydrogenase [Oscillospiraceae bacterium]
MKLGLIGEKLPHSYSKRIFEDILNYPSYDLVELKREALSDFITTTDLVAFNVTVPYKTDIIPLLKGIDERAKRIGAVNAVRREAGGFYGTNTDYDGLRILLLQSGIPIQGKSVLILGTGGTSKTAAVVCADLGARKIVKVSRRKSENAISYAEAPFAGGEVIINTTPCGMYPKTGEFPVNLRDFSEIFGVVDVIYNPLNTALIRQAKELGIPAVSGLLMLAGQAVAAEAFFLGKTLTNEQLQKRAVEMEKKLRGEIENLILTGMPGVGKTTVGTLLAKERNCPFYDTDVELEKTIGSIPDFIRFNGEEAFRNAESTVIADLLKNARGAVIATGGGAVLREENRQALSENGYVILLERSADTIVFDQSRPLSDNPEKWDQLWQRRASVYRAFADLTVAEFQTAEEACRRILEGLEK